ncbi:ATP-binding protein [Nocardia vinacea]|uniref:histidine kinase n=1 Tax=Nocardia vinacea TaxID=96468 RepID=A0ABZ1Z515_9NOCA|nr:ATP-binding protein [Nocardia vinacea]
MRDAARSGSKRWALGNWDLRWKVTAVLAVPLAVAVGLGVSRITTEFADANRLDAAAKNIETIPAVTALSAQTATTAASQMISIMPNVSIVSDKNLADLDKVIADAEQSGGKLDGVAGARASLDSMITQAKAIRAQGKNVTTQTPAEVIGMIDQVRNDSVHIVETTVGQVSDQAIEQSKLRLVDSLNTRAALVGEVAAFPEVLRGSAAGVQNAITAANTERAMLNVLAHRFSDGDTSIADLRAGIDNRISLLTSPEAQSGKIPVGDLKNSLTGSLDVYERVVNKSTKDIDTAMSSLVSNANTGAWTYTAVVIATILAALLLAVFVARSMIVPLHRLRLAALRVAESDLPHEVAQLRNGASPEDVPLEPMPIRSHEEIGQLARAVDDIHGQALRLASDQAQMRAQVNDMFETLARRSKSLVDHQLSLIEAMEYDEKDPRLLENLFRLDHLAARMRRNGDNLLILAGTRQRRSKSAPVEIADVLRAAISEVEDYERVKLGATPRGSLVEPAASDMAHLFAELLDNALRASPPETDVKFTFAQGHDQGMLIEVADRGIGMPPSEMADINRRLEQTAEPGPDTARHMGLFVVGRLAERHGLTVRLRPTFDTARDPGVTVTVQVPANLIVLGQGQTTAMPQAAPQVAAGAPQRPSAAASMQTRAITRTPGGNVMVTVDPGVSGPIPMSSPAPAAGSGPIPSAGGLPQRSPGSTMSSGASGLRQEPAQPNPTLRPSAGQPPSGPQRGKLAAANLPRRNVTPGGPPPSRPGAEPTVSGGGLPPRNLNSGGLPQRQPGTNGVPEGGQPSGGLPQRQPGSNGAPQREGAGGMPQRASGLNGLPQREPGAGGVPPRDTGSSLPQRDASGGFPQREPGSTGLPQRDSAAGGLPQRDSAAGGLPQREPGATGLPQRQSPASGLPPRETPNGLPQRESTGGLPQRESASGLPQRDALGGLPQREPTGGLPQRESTGGLPQRESAGGPPKRDPLRDPLSSLPQRETTGGLPQRESTGGLPQRESAGGLPQRESTGGLPQRDSASNGLPQRESGLAGIPPRDTGSGLPQRDSASGGLPQRDALGGLPQRESTGGLPQRESTGGLPKRDPLRDPLSSLPQRESTGGLPRRDSASNGLPQRDTGSGLPQRDSASGGLPQREAGATGLPQRQSPANGLPQRQSGAQPPSGLPQRDGLLPSRDSLPQRESAATGLPQRDPGATVLPRKEVPPGVGLPRRDRGAAQPAASGETPAMSESGATTAPRDPGRHSFKPDPEKAASFFQTRLQPAADSDSVMGGTPIFAEMMSAWLSDPNQDRSQVAASFESPGDEGWQAARRASEAQAETKTAAGLPQRNPGGRLVPGGVTGNADRTTRRDPETIRSSLSRHQQGVRDGRAMKAMNLTGDKGDR